MLERELGIQKSRLLQVAPRDARQHPAPDGGIERPQKWEIALLPGPQYDADPAQGCAFGQRRGIRRPRRLRQAQLNAGNTPVIATA